MFCDLVGSTALSARLDPEDLQRVIASYQACIGEVVGRYQGMIARYMGDGVLAYFGYPRAQEDDVEQAVRAALALVEAVAKLRTDVDAVLQARVGIATGTVVVSELLIDDAPAEQSVVGETPNLAARLQALAEPGTVLICPNTRRLTGGHFDYRYLGARALKGWAEPVPVWQVLGSSGVESRSEVMHETELPPLFGREEEIELLLRRWRHATQEEGRVVVLTGEPGIGKSHIARALDERLHGEPHVTLRYFCSAHHTNSALFPFVGQLERAAGFERSDSPAERLSKLDDLVAQSTADPEHVAVLANLLALPVSDQLPIERAQSTERQGKDAGGTIGAARRAGGTTAGLHHFRRHPMDRSDLAGTARCDRGACAAASCPAAHHYQARIHAALAELSARDDDLAHAPRPTRRRGLGRAGNGRQGTAEGGDGRDSCAHRWRASVR